jgi:hypothetical protein
MEPPKRQALYKSKRKFKQPGTSDKAKITSFPAPEGPGATLDLNSEKTRFNSVKENLASKKEAKDSRMAG